MISSKLYIEIRKSFHSTDSRQGATSSALQHTHSGISATERLERYCHDIPCVEWIESFSTRNFLRYAWESEGSRSNQRKSASPYHVILRWSYKISIFHFLLLLKNPSQLAINSLFLFAKNSLSLRHQYGVSKSHDTGVLPKQNSRTSSVLYHPFQYERSSLCRRRNAFRTQLFHLRSVSAVQPITGH